MSCNHANPAGYSFCGSCGEALDVRRCRCGFIAAAGDLFCGRCGVNLTVVQALRGTVEHEHRFDLDDLIQQAAQEHKFIESTHKVRVTQDDIRKLLATRRKKF